MNQLTTTSQTVKTTSSDLLNIINEARIEYGEKEVRRNDFVARCKDELDGEHYETFVVKNPNGTESEEIKMTDDQCAYVSMRESKSVRRKVTERLNAVRKPTPLKVVNPHTAMMIETLMKLDQVEQEQLRQLTEQTRQGVELANLQQTLAVVEARTQPENKHFTVMGYANLCGMRIDITTAAKLGKQCAELSREQGLHIGDVRDPRFGKVYSYHESILQAVLSCKPE